MNSTNRNILRNLRIDHFILGINDLQKGMLTFADRSGIRPVFRGVHPNYGTQNALISLGEECYLEVIAPQDKFSELAGPFEGVEKMEQLLVVGWAIFTSNLNDFQMVLDQFQIPNSGPTPGSRTSPDDVELKWVTTFLTSQHKLGVNPFFIQWDTKTTHPAKVTPLGCTLIDYRISIRGNDGISKLLIHSPFNSQLLVVENRPSGSLLNIVLNTPKGIVRFGQEL